MMRNLIYFLLVFSLCASGQDVKYPLTSNAWAKMTSRQRLRALTFTTPAYRKAALDMIIAEANRVAEELHLPEQLPILKTNLVSSYISPPAMTKLGIGNITTSNYVYYIAVGDKFSFLVRTHLQKEYSQLEKKYFWPMSRMDTNAAYQLATQFLNNASMDVKALNRNCKVTIRAFTPEGQHGSHFVPVYWISWGKDGNPVASVELCLPTKTLRQMHVDKSRYILRKPLIIPNLNYLLSQTNQPSSS
jgi:hypothetical protein